MSIDPALLASRNRLTQIAKDTKILEKTPFIPRWKQLQAKPPKDVKVVAKQSELSRKMFEVVDHLKACGVEQPQTIEQLENVLGIRIQDNPSLIEELRKNERIKFFQGRYSYKPRHDVRNKDELRAFLKRRNGVVDEVEFQHAFLGVDKALQELKDAGEVIAYKNGPKSFLYYIDPTLAVPMDSDFVSLWHSIKIPLESDVKKELKNSNFKVVEEEIRKVIAPKKAKKRKIRKNTKMYNTHLDTSILSKEFEKAS